jgi:hypothetical protein
MTIQQVSWNANGDIVASSDLSRNILVQKLLDSGLKNRGPTVSMIFKNDQKELISQLLLSSEGDYLLVQTPSSASVYSMETKSEVHVMPIGNHVRWVDDPSRADALIGFGYESITISSWTAIERPCQIKIQRKALDFESKSPSGDLMNRRPSTTYPMAPSEIEIKITKALLPVEGSLVLVEISYATSQRKRSKRYMMIDLHSLIRDQEVCTAKALPVELLADLEIPLGFVAAKNLNAVKRRISSVYSTSVAAVPQLNLPADEQVLAFISKDFWICTYVFHEGFSGQVQRYFFLPRDWLNTEWLELATVTADGKILCQRNGDVAIINNWMHEEWTD